MYGKLFGVGVGPGDPELLTLKACRVLREAAVLCVPVSKAKRRSLAWSVVAGVVPEGKEIIELLMPMSNDRQYLSACWDQAAGQVLTQLAAGRDVAVLTMGDPMLYSTYGYLINRIQALAPAVAVETVPGVSAVAACAARLNSPLAEGNEPLLIIPGYHGQMDFSDLLRDFPNLVIMKASRGYQEILRELEQAGRQDQAVLVSHCGTPDESICTETERLRELTPDYFSLLLVNRKKSWTKEEI